MQDLGGRVAVVTGAASGIGFAYASALAAEGMHLVLADVDGDALGAAASKLGDCSGAASVCTLRTDVSDDAAVAALADLAFGRHGNVHLLCNNAGVSLTRSLLEASKSDWEWVLGVNVWGVIHGIGSFVPRMVAAGEPGHVVNTCSISSWVVVPSYGMYSATKHAVAAISEALLGDLAAVDATIGVTAVCPSLVRTRLFSSERNRPEVLAGDAVLDDAEQRRIDDVTVGIQTPDVVAATMLEAVRSDRLWAFPNRERLDVVRERFARVLA